MIDDHEPAVSAALYIVLWGVALSHASAFAIGAVLLVMCLFA